MSNPINVLGPDRAVVAVVTSLEAVLAVMRLYDGGSFWVIPSGDWP